MIRFNCPNCNKAISVHDEHAGKKGTCSGCGEKMMIPAAKAEIVAPSSRVVTPTIVVPQPIARETDCPFCGELIKESAKKCRHCGEVLDVRMRAADEAKRHSQIAQAAPVQITNVVKQTTIVEGRGAHWNRGVAMLLSFIWPGMGQIYKGQLLNGIIWMIVVIVGYIALIVPGLVLHCCCIVGAGMGRND